MPVNFLSEADRLRFNTFPSDLTVDDLIAYFTLSDSDLRQIPVKVNSANQLGFALQLLLLRFLGFHLLDIKSLPETVVIYVAAQLSVEPQAFISYGEREQTRTDHQKAIENYLGFKNPTDEDLQDISEWLLERALEHDRPTLLLQLLCERFAAEKLVRPEFSVVERMVGTARNEAEEKIFRRVETIIDDVLSQELDGLLLPEQPKRPTPLANLRQSATSNSSKTILAGLNKLCESRVEKQTSKKN